MEKFIEDMNTSEQHAFLQRLGEAGKSGAAAVFSAYFMNASNGGQPKSLSLSSAEFKTARDIIRKELFRFYGLRQHPEVETLIKKVEDASFVLRTQSRKHAVAYLKNLAEELREKKLYYLLPSVYRKLQFYHVSSSRQKEFIRLNDKKFRYKQEETAIALGSRKFIKLNNLIGDAFLKGSHHQQDEMKALSKQLDEFSDRTENTYNSLFAGLAGLSIEVFLGVPRKQQKQGISFMKKELKKVSGDLSSYYFNNIIALLELFEELKSHPGSEKCREMASGLRIQDAMAYNYSFPGGLFLLFLIKESEASGTPEQFYKSKFEFCRDFIPAENNRFNAVSSYLFKAFVMERFGEPDKAKEALGQAMEMEKLDTYVLHELEQYEKALGRSRKVEDQMLVEEDGQYAIFIGGQDSSSLVCRYYLLREGSRQKEGLPEDQLISL